MLKRFLVLLMLVVVASLSVSLIALADNSFEYSSTNATSGDLYPPHEPEFDR